MNELEEHPALAELREQIRRLQRRERQRQTIVRRVLSAFLLAGVATVRVVAAGQLTGVPSTIPYSDAIEGIDNGTVPFRFRLFDGDAAVWSSGDVDVEVVNGRFSYLIGSEGPALESDLFADGELSIEVTINAGATGEFTFVNRQEVGSAPYAVYASLATGAAGALEERIAGLEQPLELQEYYLAADLTETAASAHAFTATGLEVGATYFLSLHPHCASNTAITVRAVHGSSDTNRIIVQADFNDEGDENERFTFPSTAFFVAEETSVGVFARSVGNGDLCYGTGDRGGTWMQLEKLPFAATHL